MTLQEAIDTSKIYDGDDFTAIRLFAEQEDKLPQVIDLLMGLVQTNTYKMEENLRRTKGYLSSPNSYYYRDYPYEVACKLDYLTRKMQLGCEFNDEDKEFMKNIKLPEHGLFWHDLSEYIKAIQDENYEPYYFNKY